MIGYSQAPLPAPTRPRPAKRGGSYAPFIPASIAERPFPLGAQAAAAVQEATLALAELADVAPRMTAVDAVARALVCVESLASSRIAGVRVSYERLAHSLPAPGGAREGGAGEGGAGGGAREGGAGEGGAAAGGGRVAEVGGNVAAVERALTLGPAGAPFEVGRVEAVHRALLGPTEDRDVAGTLRGEADWIGADDYNPVGSDFVPPPPEQLRGFLEGLCAFVERTDLEPTAQAAIAHAQFKNIHPFAAGNGRAGRALIHAVLGRRGATRTLIAPVSVVLARAPTVYAGGIGAYSVGQVEQWVEEFAAATALAAREALGLVEAVESLTAAWLERLGSPRRDSTVRQVLRALPAHPVIDAAVAQAAATKSHTAVNNALNQLERAGVLRALEGRRGGRRWEASELLALLGGYPVAPASEPPRS